MPLSTMSTELTAWDRKLAKGCLRCPVCRHARKKQHGLLFWFVKRLESRLCPQCRAYEKVTGRKAHEPLQPEAGAGSSSPP